MATRDLLRQRVLEARCAEATEACYVYEIQDDPDQPIGGHDAVLDLTAAKELDSQSATIARLEAERAKWHDRYFREVHGQNNEGDLIGGVPSGLLHDVARLEAELERVTGERDGLSRAANDLLEGVDYDGQIHNETIERLRDAAPAALSARQPGEGVGDGK